MLTVEHLCKTYRIADRREGLGGAVRHLFHPSYKLIQAVNDLSFTIEAGESLAIIGKNGAGKSSTIKMLIGLMRPTAGTIRYEGRPIHEIRRSYNKMTGVMFGQRTQLNWDIPVRESLKLLKEIYEIPDSTYRENLDTFSALLGIDAFLGRSVRYLSLGQRIRADMAAAFLHNPSIVFLDEPTIGLDILSRDSIRQFLKEINRIRKTTIIISSHDVKDIETVASTILVIDGGRNVCYDSIENVKRHYFSECSITFYTDGVPAPGVLKTITSHYPSVRITAVSPSSFELTFNRDAVSPSEVISEAAKAVPFSGIQQNDRSLEAILKDMYIKGASES